MSKLDIINSILNENFKDESEFLSEKDKDVVKSDLPAITEPNTSIITP